MAGNVISSAVITEVPPATAAMNGSRSSAGGCGEGWAASVGVGCVVDGFGGGSSGLRSTGGSCGYEGGTKFKEGRQR